MQYLPFPTTAPAIPPQVRFDSIGHGLYDVYANGRMIGIASHFAPTKYGASVDIDGNETYIRFRSPTMAMLRNQIVAAMR